MKCVHLRPRLQAAADMLLHARCAADIGCDHGRLCAALLQSGRAERAVGVDISEPSLAKAQALRTLCGLEDVWALRAGDGLLPLAPGEADAIFLCGMGGETIASILGAGGALAGEASLYMQPMGGAAELRRYLCGHGYAIFDERIALDAGRYYQLLAARPGTPPENPPGFPAGMYAFGALLFTRRDPLLLPMLRQCRAGHARRLARARKSGESPAALLDILRELDTLINLEGELNRAPR